MINELNKNISIEPWNLSFKAFFISAIVCLLSVTIQSQNIQTKTINAEGLTRIEIDGDQIFNIEVKSSSRKDVFIESTLDGSYQNEYQILNTEAQGVVKLRLKRLDYIQIPDDKRNAHKIVAAKLSLIIPENLRVQVLSDIGSLEMFGQFQSVKAQLSQGYFKMNGTATSTYVSTIDGDILIATNNVDVDAHSTNGVVEVSIFESSINQMQLQSVNGNISVTMNKR